MEMSDTTCDSLEMSTTYSPEYVSSLLLELERTLSQPNAWRSLSVDELTAVAETLARLNAKDRSLLQLLDSILCAKDYIDSKNLTKLLNAYAHLGFLEGALLSTALRARPSFGDMDPSQLSSLLFALGKLKLTLSEQPALPGAVSSLGLSNSELTQILQRLCTRAVEVHDRFSLLEISTIVFAMARLGYRNTKLLHLFADTVAQRISEASPQVASNTVYAMGKLGFKSATLLDAVCDSIPDRLALFKPQEIANLVYAFGQLEYRNEQFLLTLADHIPSRLSSFKPQELSITAYAYSQLRVSHPRMFGGIAIQIARRIDECSPQAISNTVYAMSKVSFRHNGLLTALALSLPARLRELTPQHVSNIMYAFGKLGHRDEYLLNAICSHVPGRLWEFRPQNIANTVYATGKLGYRHDVLLTAVATHLPQRMHECVSQDISNIVYSFGLVGFRHEAFFSAVESHVRNVLVPRGLQQKDMSYLMSAFRKAGIEYSEEAPVRPVIALEQLLGETGGGGDENENPLKSLIDELDQAALACNVDLLSCLEPLRSITFE
jgi:hypothetical protein